MASVSKFGEASEAINFRVIDGKYRYIGGIEPDEIELRESLDELIDTALGLEREAQMKAKLSEMQTFSGLDSPISRFLSLQTFGEANQFFSTVSMTLSESALSNLRTFLDANLKFFGQDYKIDKVSLQTLFDIITSQKDLYILIGMGGEGSVYRKEYRQDSCPKLLEPVVLGSEPGSKIRPKPQRALSHGVAAAVAVKVLKDDADGGYACSSPEVVVSRSATHSPLLRGSCVSPVQIDKFNPRSMALCMEMGVSSMAKFFSEEKNVGRRLVKVLQMAENVVDLAAQGLVHRDLKPDNFMLTKSGDMVIIDPSQIQRVGEKVQAAFSTIIYSSPRETTGVLGKEMIVNPAVDVWSLGIMLYEAVAGNPLSLSKGLYKSMLIIADKNYIDLILPEAAYQEEWDAVLKIISNIGESLESSLDALREVETLSDLKLEIKTVAGGASYLFERSRVVEILKKPLLEISTDDFKFLETFLESNYSNVIEETHSQEIQLMVQKIRTIQTNRFFTKYPDLKRMCKKLIAVDPEERGSAADFVKELSSFLVNHPEFLS